LVARVGLHGESVHAVSIAIALALATASEMVLAELVPKNFAIARPIPAARSFVGPLRFFAAVFRPLIVFLNEAANWTLRRLRIEPREELRSVRSMEELELLVRISGVEGTLERAEETLLTRTIRFSRKTAADVLVPRGDMVALPGDATVLDLFDAARASGHSRFPVYGADHDDILGIVHAKDGYAVPEPDRATTTLAGIARPAEMVPINRELAALLHDMRAVGSQMALVIDEYGGVDGIVTIEDLLEEIVGEIEDEYDLETGRSDVDRTASGSWLVSGRLHLDELSDATSLALPDGPYETLAGFLLDRLGRIPTPGERVECEGWKLDVVELEGHRIAWVQLTAAPEDGPGADAAAQRR
ncbi:MAG: hemolysin family protein, partial [Acidimicrobiia bacterium]